MSEFFDGLTERLVLLATGLGMIGYGAGMAALRSYAARKRPIFRITPRRAPGLRGLS